MQLKDKQQEIVNKYNSGMTTYALCKEYNVTYGIIQRILYLNKVKMRRSNDKIYAKYTLDENYFNTINTPNKAYVLGFLHSDGCIKPIKRKGEITNSLYLSVSISERDKQVVEFIKKELNATNPIYFHHCYDTQIIRGKRYKIRPQVTFRVINNKLVTDLFSINMGNKAVMPIIPDKFMPDFIRGVFDGDGWFTISWGDRKDHLHLRGGITGLEPFLSQIQSYLKKHNINSYFEIPHIRKNCVSLKFTYHNAHKFAALIYYSDNCFCLQRKKEKYLKVIENRKLWAKEFIL